MHPIETLCRNCRHACSIVQCGVPPDMLFLRLAGSNKIYSQSRTAHGGACCNLTTLALSLRAFLSFLHLFSSHRPSLFFLSRSLSDRGRRGDGAERQQAPRTERHPPRELVVAAAGRGSGGAVRWSGAYRCGWVEAAGSSG